MEKRIESANACIENKKQEILESFKAFLAIPSISSDPAFKDDMKDAAHWLMDQMEKIGIGNIALLETGNHPVVYGDYDCGDKNKPTILLYGHYDVQPPDPLDEWKTKPFKASIVDNKMVGRGSSDMKGQIMVFLSAIQAILETGKMPVNLKFMIEGEEEIGSPSIEAFIEKHKERFACDFVLNLDAGSLSKDQPSIVYGLRGLAYFEIHVTGPGHDLHSGLFGGVVYNPIQALSNLVSGMIDDHGVIQLPRFYDDVALLSNREKAEMAKLGLDEAYYLEQTGAKATFGEKGYTPTERIGARPTLDVNGIYGGYSGVGPKTVIPSKAVAKLSMRLVPNQSPRKVHEQLLAYMEENAPDEIIWEVKVLSTDMPYVTDPYKPHVQCFANALKSVWGIEPIFQREGGSIPISSNIQDILGASSILSGFALPDDRIHSPNERMDMDMFWNGIRTLIIYIYSMGAECE